MIDNHIHSQFESSIMKILKNIITASALYSSLFLLSCDEAIVKSSEEVSPTLLWQGVLPEAPDSAKTNWVYFNSKEEITLIFNGDSWDTLAVSGIDGTPIIWLGALSTFPIQKKMNRAFYHKNERVSYICDGESWNLFSVSGKHGTGVNWLGNLDQEPVNPPLLTSYYDTLLKRSRIWNGTSWDDFSIDGINGIALTWIGSADGFPNSPNVNDAFYNSSEGVSFIWDGSDWMVLSRDGLIGKSGTVIQWQGEFPEEPESPENNWAYYNTTNGNCYIFHSDSWTLLSHAGKNGSAITWRGISDVEPEKPSINDVYRSTKDGNAYIFNGSGWELFCEGGINGENGLNGLDIIWKGGHSAPPEPAEVNWVYYNYLEKVSYCYNGSSWKPMLKSGVDGFEITWLGEFYSDPIDGKPLYGSVYYNRMDNISYFWDGYDWVHFVQGGAKAMDGRSIMWLGENTSHPTSYHSYSMYYNTLFKKTYVYRYGYWEPFFSNGINGVDGMTNNLSSRQLVNPMDSITIHHFYSDGLIIPTGEYLGKDSMLHSVDYPSPEWIGHLDLTEVKPLCPTEYLFASRLMEREDGSLIQIYADSNGGRFFSIDKAGVKGTETQFTSETTYHFSSVEQSDGTLLFSYVNKNGEAQITQVTTDNKIVTVAITPGLKTVQLNMILRNDGTPMLIYKDEYYDNYCVLLNTETMTLSSPIQLKGLDGSLTMHPLNDGTVAVASIRRGVFVQIVNDTEIIREFTIGKTDAIDITSMTQTPHGALLITYNRRYRFSYASWKTVSMLAMATPGGDELKSYDLIDKPVYDISVTPDTTGIDVIYSSNGKSYLQKYDGRLEQLYSYPLERSLSVPSFVKLSEDEFIVTGAGEENKGLLFGNIKRTSDDISVKLKRLQNNEYTLINHTGTHIELKLTLCKYTDKGN